MKDTDLKVDADRFKVYLTAATLRGKNLRPLFEGKLDKSIQSMLKRQFDTKGRWGGTPWAPLKRETKKRRIRRGGNRGGLDHPLWDTGRLRASLLKRDGPDVLRKVGALSIERGTLVPYAAAHQRGKRKGLAARPIVPSPPRHIVQSWGTLVARYIAQTESGP